MRELKFRVWNNSDRKMLFNVSILQEAPESEYGTLVKNKITGVVGIERSHIMQYTGIKDKNNKEIYEGDIIDVRIPEDYGGTEDEEGRSQFLCRQKVEWSKTGGYFSDEDTGEYRPLLGSEEIEIEIRGNIYQNPELLEDDRAAF